MGNIKNNSVSYACFLYLQPYRIVLTYTQGVTIYDSMGRWLTFQPVFTYTELPYKRRLIVMDSTNERIFDDS